MTDELVSVEEAHQLLRIAKKGLAKGGGAGGASILGHGTHPGKIGTCRLSIQTCDYKSFGSGIRCLFNPLDPGSGMKKQDPDLGSGSGMNNPDHISENLETNFLSSDT